MPLIKFLIIGLILCCEILHAAEQPPIKAQPPVMDREYVLIQNGQNIGMSGCLALSADAQVHWIEDHPTQGNYDGFGYSTHWDLNNLTMTIRGYTLGIDENQKLIATKSGTHEILYRRSDPNRERKSPYVLILRDAKTKQDFTLKIEPKSVKVRSKTQPERSIEVHQVFVREGLDGAEFMFHGMSK